MNKKVAFFTYTRLEYGGGVAKYFIDIASGLMKRNKNIQIDIVTFNENTLKKILFLYYLYFGGKQDMDRCDKDKFDYIRKKLVSVGYFKLNFFEVKAKLKEYDVVYTTNNLLELLFIKFIVGCKNIPLLIYGFHVPILYEITKTWQSKMHNIIYASRSYTCLLQCADKLHVINNFNYKYLKKKLSKSKVYKIYNPFNFGDFIVKGKKFKYQFQWKKDKINILWIGRLTIEKGISELIGIINDLNLSGMGDKIIWNIVGDGELQNKISQLTFEWKNVNYHGYQKYIYIPSIISNNNIFISTSKGECFPYGLLEAQSFGLPVIAFNIHGVSDIIENGINGFLVSNTRELEDGLIDFVLGKKELMNKKEIKKYIREKFDSEDSFRRLYSLFN